MEKDMELEITPEDIKAMKDALKKLKRPYPPVKKKWIDPVTKATWSGRGHTPKWFYRAEKYNEPV